MNPFRTSLVHSCHSPELSEPRPEVCKCRRLVTREKAVEMVKVGEADWLIRYDLEVPTPTWNICLRGRTSKTPRAHTLEKAHIQRGLERRDELADRAWLSDEGQMAKNMDAMIEGAQEQIELFELYHQLELMERYNFFRGCAPDLQELKKFSDTFGTVEGAEGKYVEEIIESRANELKLTFALDDPFEGRCLFPIGRDERT